MKYARIIGTGSYLPQQIMTNADLALRIETTNEWIVDRTGIERRHIAGPHETAGSMAEQAARAAIDAAAISPNDIDFIIVATTTPDYICPSVACLLQHRLGIKGCAAFDLVAACSGFIYGMSVADQYIKSGMAKNVLVVASEIMSHLLDWDDRRTCVLFGDGAGAVILQASDQPGIRSTHIHADGTYEALLWVPSALPAQRKPDIEPTLKMQGNEVFKLAVNTLSQCVDEVLQHNKIKEDEIDWLIPHQANIRIIQGIAKKLNLPMEKVVLTVAEHGNTSAASIPLALDRAVRDGRIKRNDTLLLEAFGAGLTWGSALVDY
jgi:3-oxoacyl-[acyl-carrier-protein] synthase III